MPRLFTGCAIRSLSYAMCLTFYLVALDFSVTVKTLPRDSRVVYRCLLVLICTHLYLIVSTRSRILFAVRRQSSHFRHPYLDPQLLLRLAHLHSSRARLQRLLGSI